MAGDGIVDAHGLGSVLEHDHTERAGDRDGVGLLGAQLFEADDAGLFVAVAFHPDVAATAATAHCFVAIGAGGLDQLDAGDRLEELTRGVVDVVVAADVAGIVVGDLLFDFGDGLELVVAHQAGQVLGVMDDLVVDAGTAAELAVFVFVRVVAVGAGGHQGFEGVLAQRADVGLGLLLEQQLLTHAAGGVAGAALFATEDGKVDVGLLEQLCHGAGGALGAVVVAGRTTDPKEDVGAPLLGHGGQIEASSPGGAFFLGQTPWVIGTFDAVQHFFDAAGDFALDHGQITAEVDHQVDVVDHGRAFFDTGAAGGAAPQFVFVVDTRLEQPDGVEGTTAGAVALEDHLVTGFEGDGMAALHVGHFGDQELGRQVGARRVGGADRLAAAAGHARIEVEALLPGQIVDGGDAQLRFVLFDFGLEIGNRCQRTTGSRALEERIEWGIDEMAQPGERDGRDECKRHHGVGHPQRQMQAQADAADIAQAYFAEHHSQPIADERLYRPVLLEDHHATDGLIGDTQAFDEIPADTDKNQRNQRFAVVAAVVQSI